jgi:O-antigen/teichoic acid export membrane protein
MVANLASRVMAMVVVFASAGLTLPYLGAERFGAWMTVVSLSATLTFLDMGVGNALTNRVSAAASLNSTSELRKVITGGLGFLAIIGAMISIFLLSLTFFLPWKSWVIVLDPDVLSELDVSAKVFSLLFGLSIFSSGVQRVFVGLQKSYESHAILTFVSIISLVGVIWGASQEYGIVPLLLITFGGPVLAGFFLLYVLYCRSQFSHKIIYSSIQSEWKGLIKVGTLFLILQIGVMVGWGADSIIIVTNLGVEAVAGFAIVQRLFNLLTQPMYIFNGPLWGAYADAHNRGDQEFLKNTLIKSVFITAIFSVVVFVFLSLFGNFVIDIWLSNSMFIPQLLLFSFGLWAVCESVGNSFAMFLNGCGVVKQQVFVVVTMCIFAIPVKLYLIKSQGLEAMILGFVIVYLLVHFIFYGVIFKKSLSSIFLKPEVG